MVDMVPIIQERRNTGITSISGGKDIIFQIIALTAIIRIQTRAT
jgi:hypothetical protein